MKKINYCTACGKIIDKYGSIKNQLCSKHFQQLRRFGKTLDANQRTVNDPNEIRIYKDWAEIDTYDSYGNVLETYKLDLEDIKYINNNKWRTVYKGKNKAPYLVNPNCEIYHINGDTHNNQKSNLRFATRQEQLYNTLRCNKIGIKGVYYNPKRPNKPWHCEFQNNGKRYYSPQCETKEEAAYYRYLFESIFMKDILICNTKELQDYINNLSEEKKLIIQKYFRNKMKI